MTELEPCPFCQKTAFLVGDSDRTYHIAAYWVECDDCGARGPLCGAEEEATASWNRVARAVRLNGELVEALKDALAVIEDYLAYKHDGDPWSEDARLMGEMDINDYEFDGRLEKARAVYIKAKGGES